MPNPACNPRLCVLALAPVLPALVGQEPVVLLNLPERIELPVAKGAQALGAARVTGPRPRAVWLAVREDAPLRLMLHDDGSGRYPVDLADPALPALLRLEGDEGRLRVFAEFADGRVTGSRALTYAFRRPEPSAWRALVAVGEHRTQIGPSPARKTWWQPERVLKVEIEGPGGEHPRAFARIGAREWPLRHDSTRGAFCLETDAAIRSAWQQAGVLICSVEGDQAPLAEFVLHARPAQLALAGGEGVVAVVQRDFAELPGSHGYLRVAIDDVTHQQVLVTIRSAEGETLLAKRSMRAGDSAPFLVGDEVYTLVLSRLANLLIGDDYAEFKLRQSAAQGPPPLDTLLRRIEAAEITFLREGSEYSGAQAAAHLRAKLAAAHPAVLDLEEFIVRIASRSSLTGRSYQVRTKAGVMVPAEAWLRELGKDLLAPAASRPTSRR